MQFCVSRNVATSAHKKFDLLHNISLGERGVQSERVVRVVLFGMNAV